MDQRYRARWKDEQGRQREFLFESPGSLSIARIDLKLKLIDRGVTLPQEYQLDEVPHGFLVQTGGVYGADQ